MDSVIQSWNNCGQECGSVVTWLLNGRSFLVLLGAEFHSGEVAIIFNILLSVGFLWSLLAEEIQPGIPHTQHEINKIPLWRVLQRPRARYLSCVVWLVLRTSSENWATCVNGPSTCSRYWTGTSLRFKLVPVLERDYEYDLFMWCFQNSWASMRVDGSSLKERDAAITMADNKA